MSVRSVLRRSPTLVRGYRFVQEMAGVGSGRPAVDFDQLPPGDAVRLAYQVVLGRDPDPVGWADFSEGLASGRLTTRQMVEALRGSEEFCNEVRFSAGMLGHSIHTGRCQFIKSLPPARRIVDLGGTHLHREVGAMVAMGYPYRFDELVIIDLPSDERHAIYRGADGKDVVATPLGPVRYRYHSMTDLSSFADGSVDLVYSGQSIEHVTPDDGRGVLGEVARILRPGGHLGLDTPNARVTRLQQEAFIDPDHKVEYTLEELLDLVRGAGLEPLRVEGLNYAGRSLEAGRFDLAEVSGNSGIYAAAADCYILCVVARKPGPPGDL